ncbi:MAG: rod shape-determining protein RodA [Chloroflexi bacterium]|nr:rod shape-determining protein RodA [Chloroflexota bacterium]
MKLQRWRDLDFVMLGAAGLLVLYGMVLIHSATCPWPCERVFPPTSWTLRQGLYGLLGAAIIVLLTFFDYRGLRALAYWAYGFGLLLLGVVLLVGKGQADYGARRWLTFGGADLQPSEVGKVLVVLALARFLAEHQEGPLTLRRVLGSAALVFPPVFLVYLQPDLGTSLSYLAIWFVMLLVARVRHRHVALMLGLGLLSLPLGWLALRDYMRQRLLTFFATLANPETDPFGEGYNILQARISIGSGGLLGRGLTEGTQTQLDYLRVKHSDFIFSVLAEELGFVGALVLVGLFLILLFRIIRVADRSADGFGRLMAFGLAGMLFYQVFVNLGANLTLLPVTGMPLPFVSYGGSALVTDLAALGLLQSVLYRRLKYRY